VYFLDKARENLEILRSIFSLKNLHESFVVGKRKEQSEGGKMSSEFIWENIKCPRQ